MARPFMVSLGWQPDCGNPGQRTSAGARLTVDLRPRARLCDAIKTQFISFLTCHVGSGQSTCTGSRLRPPALIQHRQADHFTLPRHRRRALPIRGRQLLHIWASVFSPTVGYTYTFPATPHNTTFLSFRFLGWLILQGHWSCWEAWHYCGIEYLLISNHTALR